MNISKIGQKLLNSFDHDAESANKDKLAHDLFHMRDTDAATEEDFMRVLGYYAAAAAHDENERRKDKTERALPSLEKIFKGVNAAADRHIAKVKQPAAKEKTRYSVVHRPETCQSIQSGKPCDCAKQEGAPAAEQGTRKCLECGADIGHREWCSLLPAYRAWTLDQEQLRDNEFYQRGFKDGKAEAAPSPAQESAPDIPPEKCIVCLGDEPCSHDFDAVSSPSENTKRLDWLESHCFTNREGERQISYDFSGSLRLAIDAAMASPSASPND